MENGSVKRSIGIQVNVFRERSIQPTIPFQAKKADTSTQTDPEKETAREKTAAKVKKDTEDNKENLIPKNSPIYKRRPRENKVLCSLY